MTDKRDFSESEEMDRPLAEFAERAATPLRAPVHPTEGFQARTIAAVRREGSERFDITDPRGPLAWLLSPRTVRVSPIAALTLVASLVLAVALGTVALTRGSANPGAPGVQGAVASAPTIAAPETVQVVRFQLAAPNAHTVALVGDFNDWSRDAIILRPADKPGVWTASVPLKPGRHEYAFVVDGKRWVPDPYANTHTDEFNVESSIVHVGQADTE
jgi:Carbohydrate-binding module 48 (Isoamylase N-terminal domain)